MFFATFYIIANIFQSYDYGCCTDAFLGKVSVGQALNF